MRILVDMTETALHGYNTGIQRVVRNVVSRIPRLAATLGVEIVPVVAIGSRLHAVPDPVAAAPVRVVPRPSAGSPGAATRPPLRQIVGRFVERVPGARAALWRWRQHRLYGPLRAQHYEPVAVSKGDLYLLLDSFCGRSTVVSALTAVRAVGTRTVVVIYDLIPITHPQFCDDRIVNDFRRECPRVLAQADAVLAISASVAQQVESYASQAVAGWNSRRRPVSSFHLGADLTARRFAPEKQAGVGWPAGLWDGESPVFLMLGTLEPRKGHALVLQAFERRWDAGHREKLLFIGAAGWKTATLQERIRTSPHLGHRLFLVEDASDAAVAEAITRSRAGIVASYVEGFGLPLVEFMQMGLPVLASDIPVFREIGGRFPVYFPLAGPESLTAALERFYRDEAEIRREVATFHWLTWDEAAETLLRNVLAVCA